MGLCSGEGPICPSVSLDLGGDASVEVERFVRLSLSSASWGVHIRRKPPSLKYKERVREEFSGRYEPVYRSLPVTGVSLGQTVARGHIGVLSPFVGWHAQAVLGKARGAKSHEDRRIEQFRQNQQGIFGAVLRRGANWPGRRHASTLRDMHKLVAGLGELPPSCGWSASSSSLSNLSVIEPSVGEVDHAVPEYTPSAFRGGLRKVNAHGLVQITRYIALEIEKTQVARTVLSMDGGSRLKGVNSLKSSEDLWGPIRWHSRLDSFPYSEPLTNLASYFGARGISDEKAINKHASKQKESSPNPLDIPSGVAKLCAPEFNLVGARMREAYATRLGSIHLPGDTRRTHVRRSRHLLFKTRRSRAVELPGSRGTGYT
ncbi:hypothetical protein CRG98_006363 [Punica granatum]|uniref:Uncharacterized protein n=1 Tax=Punica granatum TaxID=22663 RepID=A0A2I0KXM9_PUNGR|nr:hypothetical protein CRG98_006363 [Punica granatum]